jgi:hypothetical protein
MRKLRPNEIGASELRRYLYGQSSSQEKRLEYHDSGLYAMKTTIGGVRVLAARGLVCGVIKRGELSSIRLLVSARAAHRILNGCAPLNTPALSISKPRKSKGAKEWAPRFDHAKIGAGGSRVLTHTPQAEVFADVPVFIGDRMSTVKIVRRVVG